MRDTKINEIVEAVGADDDLKDDVENTLCK